MSDFLATFLAMSAGNFLCWQLGYYYGQKRIVDQANSVLKKHGVQFKPE